MCGRPRLKGLHVLTAAGCSVRPLCCAANVGKHITWLNEAEVGRVAGRWWAFLRKTNEASGQLWRKCGNEELINGNGGGGGQSMASGSPDHHNMFQCSRQRISAPAAEYRGILVFPSLQVRMQHMAALNNYTALTGEGNSQGRWCLHTNKCPMSVGDTWLDRPLKCQIVKSRLYWFKS